MIRSAANCRTEPVLCKHFQHEIFEDWIARFLCLPGFGCVAIERGGVVERDADGRLLAFEPVYHAVADEAVPFKEIAAVIGRQLPVEARPREHFGWFATMAGADMAASSAHTRTLLDWQPSGPGLLADLDQPGYYAR